MFHHVLDFIAPIVFGQALMLSALLWVKSKTAPEARWLSLLCIVVSLPLLYTYGITTNYNNVSRTTLYIMLFSPWLYGPLLWLYTKAILKRPVHKAYIHLSPSLVAIFLFLAIKLFASQQTVNIWVNVQMFIIFAVIFVYLGFTIIQIVNYHKHLEGEYADLEPYTLHWLIYLTFAFFVVLLFDLSAQIIFFFNQELAQQFFTITGIAEACMIMLVSAFALYRPAVSKTSPATISNDKTSTNEVNQGISGRKHLRLDDTTRKLIADNLTTLMHQQKLYQQNGLTIGALAKHLNITSHELSEVINESIGASFYEYINGLRIKQATEILKNNQNKKSSMLDVAFEVGFGNKTTFNREFKKRMAVTPSDYTRALPS